MNLMYNRIKSDVLQDGSITTFRKRQYDFIPQLCNLVVNYISKQYDDFLTLTELNITNDNSYQGLNNSLLTTIVIKGSILGAEPIELLNFVIPKLINDQYIYLNGNYYIPAFYAVDMPISNKNSSCKINGLFNSLSILFKQDHCTFLNLNIPLNYLFQLLFNKNEDPEFYSMYNKLKQQYKLSFEDLSDDTIINYFVTKLKNVTPTKKDIIKKIENLLFDDYIVNLYKHAYKFNEVTLKNVLFKSIQMQLSNNKVSFIDLNYKRIIFLESLLKPFLKIVGINAKLAALDPLKYNPHNLTSFNKLQIVKHFLTPNDPNKEVTGLGGESLYCTYNMYDGMLQYKLIMVQPGIKNPPAQVRGIHPSHFGVICPITITNEDPGKSVSLIPSTLVSDYGLIIKND